MVGNTYRYDVVAQDVDGDAVTYALDTISQGKGMVIDQNGRVSWKPGSSNIGNHQVVVTVTDAFGKAVNQAYSLAVAVDNAAPLVSFQPSSNFANIGETIYFQINATDNVGIGSRQLVVNNQAVALDNNGVGSYTVTAVGVITAQAIVTDANGNVSTSNTTVNVIDPTDVDAPVVNVTFPTDNITGIINIVGSVTDTNLDYYVLEVALAGTDNYKEVFRGTSNVTNGLLGKFDPSGLANDTYNLRLTAFDVNGKGIQIDQDVAVASELKLGNFRLSFTDIAIPVAGVPITLTRTYDTLTANNKDDFGYGWRMEFRDTDLRTSLKRDVLYEELGYFHSVGFQDGDRVYITLPGGKREGFTFRAVPVGSNGDFGSAYIVNAVFKGNLWKANFDADKGNTSKLTVPQNTFNFDLYGTGTSGNPDGGNLDALLIRDKNNKLVNLAGKVYRPDEDVFGNRYRLTTKDGTVYEINATTGDLESVKDTNGNTLTYSDTEIVSSNGQKVVFERDNQGRIVSVTDPLGAKIRYEYDANGDLVGVTDRDGNTTRYQYNATQQHYLDKIIDPLGREAVKTEYDAQGRLKKTTNATGNGVEFIYDPANSIQVVKDALGNATTYEYDVRGNIVTEIDAIGKITKSTFDDDNNILSETVISDRSGSTGFTTTYTYDGQKNKLSETDALGNTTYYQRDIKGGILSVTDPLGRTMTNIYDNKGNLLTAKDVKGEVILFSYNDFGKLLHLTNEIGQTTYYTYDANGNLLTTTNALGHTTDYIYDQIGNLLSESQRDGEYIVENHYTYDRNGNKLTSTNALGHTTKYIYNDANQQIAVIDPLSHVTNMIYDDEGRLIETILPDLTPDDLSDNPRTKIQYDSVGNEIANIDPLGRVTHMVYDKSKRLVETILPDLTPENLSDNPRFKTEYYTDGLIKASIDQLGRRTEYRYDAAGRQIAIIYPDDSPNDLTNNPISRTTYNVAGEVIAKIDALGNTTKYQHDEFGRLTTTTFADGNYTNNEYDKLGRKISFSDQNGNNTQYKYDGLNRLTEVKDALGSTTRYQYDELNRMVSAVDAEGRNTSYEYDKLGRKTAIILPAGQRSTTNYDASDNIISSTDFNGHTISFGYDSENRIIKKIFQDGSKVSYSYTLDGLTDLIIQEDSNGNTLAIYDQDYDGQNRLIMRSDTINGVKLSVNHTYDLVGNRISVSTPNETTYFTYDERNRLKSVTNNLNGVTDYNYDSNNNLIRTIFSNGVIESRYYDALNRLLGLVNTNSNNSTLSSYHYTLDKVGNRVELIENTGRKIEYLYDKLHRLLSESITDLVRGNLKTTFTYDKVGNRLNQNRDGSITNYEFDVNDRLLSEKINGEIAVAYTYDNNGSILKKVESNKTTQYSWNDDKRLIGIRIDDDNGIKKLIYQYDENGIRVASTIDSQQTRFLLDTVQPYSKVLKEYVDGIEKVSYIYGNNLISQTRENNTSYFLVDGLGSTRALTDSNGSITNTYDYDSFGKLTNISGSILNKYLFTGEQLDSVTGSYYLRDRFYDIDNGRFTRADTFSGNVLNPTSLNKYIYAHNNPISYTDPSGFSPNYNPFYRDLGKEIHKIIGLDFVSSGFGRLSDSAISTIIRASGDGIYKGLNANKRPDLADTINREIYEIKSATSRLDAYAKLAFYEAILNTAPNTTTWWGGGTLYHYNKGPQYLPQYNKVFIVEPTNLGGVIYHVKSLKSQTDLVEVLDLDAILTTVNSLNAAYFTIGLTALVASISFSASLGLGF